jgi:predicted CXXCH cytochrome family protein
LPGAPSHIVPVVRAVAFACIGLWVVPAALASACDERFPGESTSDGGPATEGGSSVGPIEARPPGIISPDRRLNASSSPVVFDPVRNGVWTANGDVGSISYVDLNVAAGPAQVAEIAVGQDIRSIALSPDAGWIAAVDRSGASVVLVEAETRRVRRTIPLGTHPRACVWDAANPRWLYVAIEDDGAVAVIDRTIGEATATIDVGRIPSGLAVSRDRRELYVTHRIDADVTVVDLRNRTVAAHVSLADEPFSALATPNGKPFGFESLAITADGSHVWVPHELLAPTHPFVFSETLFPAISVVDLMARAEQRTIANPIGRIDGRKNLFDAINLLGRDGQPIVFSQICGVVMHPGGTAAWALACGSEDLITFGAVEGVATDHLPSLPCDHPVGLSLDDTGQRIFVACDQSHTLLTIDTADGSLVGHAKVSGDPIALVQHDPIDPELRAGQVLFFRANSSKGTLATTGNNWMACGGCHLDGFGSNNLRLFESLVAHDPQRDAQIGHVGLKDNFSTVPDPTSTEPARDAGSGTPTFNPHDILSALLDQGGLAPDRAGAVRDGQIDPTQPTVDARRMAEQLARVIARDLPKGPTWLASSGVLNVAWDTTFCKDCHQAEYAAWSKSLHAHSAEDPMVLYCAGREQELVGPQYLRLCAGCHDPVGARTGDVTLKKNTGITCLGCHDVDREIHAGGNGDLQVSAHDWTADHKAWGLASLEKLRQPEFCGGCHQQFVPGTGLLAISTLDEYQASPYAGTVRCVDCHMRKDANGAADHHFPGGNLYLAQAKSDKGQFGDDALIQAQKANLTQAVSLEARRVAGGVWVTVLNGGAGHSFPTGVTDLREAWVELQTKDSSGQTIHIGGPTSERDPLPTGASRLGIDIATADGTILDEHELSSATRIPFDVRVPAGQAQALHLVLPPGMAQASPLDAVLYYRNVRTTYYRKAVRDSTAAAPSFEVARVAVQ